MAFTLIQHKGGASKKVTVEYGQKNLNKKHAVTDKRLFHTNANHRYPSRLEKELKVTKSDLSSNSFTVDVNLRNMFIMQNRSYQIIE